MKEKENINTWEILSLGLEVAYIISHLYSYLLELPFTLLCGTTYLQGVLKY